MDAIFDGLTSIRKAKRTTYKKVSEAIEYPSGDTDVGIQPPPVPQSLGFLFENSLLENVRKRLNGETVEDQSVEHSVIKESENGDDGKVGDVAFALNVSKTQNISELYSGGEELEDDLQKTQKIQSPTQIVLSVTQPVTTQTQRLVGDTPESNQLNVRDPKDGSSKSSSKRAGPRRRRAKKRNPRFISFLEKVAGKYDNMNGDNSSSSDTSVGKADDDDDEDSSITVRRRARSRHIDVVEMESGRELDSESEIEVDDEDEDEESDRGSSDEDYTEEDAKPKIGSRSILFGNLRTVAGRMPLQKTEEQPIVTRTQDVHPAYTQNLNMTEVDIAAPTGIKTQIDAIATQIIEPLRQTVEDLGSTASMNSSIVNETLADMEATQRVPTTFPTEIIPSLPQTAVDSIQNDETIQPVQPRLKIHEIMEQMKEEARKEEERRNVEYKPVVRKILPKLTFTKESFFKSFDESDNDISEEDEHESGKGTNIAANAEISKDKNLQTIEELSTIGRPTQSRKMNHVTMVGLSTYKTVLKSRSSEDHMINLDSDSDDNQGIQQPDIPVTEASKATLLNIKVRLSKRKGKNRALQSNKPTLNKLFSNLMKASRRQILDHQREVVETRGLRLEDMEKEKEMVENLLEQEILRNKKIREKEKERERKRREEEELDFDHSANELDESDFGDYESSETDIEDKMENDEEEITQENAEDEEFGLIKSKRAKRRYISNDTDSEEETPAAEALNSDKTILTTGSGDGVTSPKNVVDLGHYGDNLPSSPAVNEDFDEEKDKGERVQNASFEDSDDVFEAKRLQILREERKRILAREKALINEQIEMRKSGVSELVEQEAEESEDEWYGLGGADGELSDVYDSEVERMIDDISKTDFNLHQVREMITRENKEMDRKLVEKILYRLKNGGLKKRGIGNLDLELSDDEDLELREYRKKRRELMKQKRLDLGADEKLTQNPKSKAFFESMVEDIEDSKNPFSAPTIVEDVYSDTESDSHGSPLSTSPLKIDLKVKDYIAPKKIVISEDFVQKSLSFLNEDREERYASPFRHNQPQTLQPNDRYDDFNSLKSSSSIKFLKSPSKVDDNKGVGFEQGVNVGENEDTEFRFHHQSIKKLFGFKTDINDKFLEGSKTVRVAKGYKAAGSSKASITYMGRVRKLVAPKRKQQTLPRRSKSRIDRLVNSQVNKFEG